MVQAALAEARTGYADDDADASADEPTAVPDDPLPTVLRRLGRCLLLLDHLEIGASADGVGAYLQSLLQKAPELRLLITSSDPINLPGVATRQARGPEHARAPRAPRWRARSRPYSLARPPTRPLRVGGARAVALARGGAPLPLARASADLACRAALRRAFGAAARADATGGRAGDQAARPRRLPAPSPARRRRRRRTAAPRPVAAAQPLVRGSAAPRAALEIDVASARHAAHLGVGPRGADRLPLAAKDARAPPRARRTARQPARSLARRQSAAARRAHAAAHRRGPSPAFARTRATTAHRRARHARSVPCHQPAAPYPVLEVWPLVAPSASPLSLSHRWARCSASAAATASTRPTAHPARQGCAR